MEGEEEKMQEKRGGKEGRKRGEEKRGGKD
jgi:hypothetical protein